MASAIRILVASSAVFERHALRAVFDEVSDCLVVGSCATGRELLEQLASRPDVVVMEFGFSDLRGSEVLREIRKRDAALPVVVVSQEPMNDWQSEAIRAGASTCVAKVDDKGQPLERAPRELLARVRLCGMQIQGLSLPARRQTSLMPLGVSSLRPRSRVELVVIGSSTGGPSALPQVLSRLPASFAVPVVVVQHMPSELFTESLAKSLATTCPLRVSHASQGEIIVGPGIWIAPGNRHLSLVRSGRGLRVDLQDGPPLHGVRPAVDPLFQSAAVAKGSGVLGVLLTGMGRDGSVGSEAIARAGGVVIVQDEATSVVWGMPGAVAGAGFASAVLPLGMIGREIVARTTATSLAPVC